MPVYELSEAQVVVHERGELVRALPRRPPRATPNTVRDPDDWYGKMVTKSRLPSRFVIFIFHFIEKYIEESKE